VSSSHPSILITGGTGSFGQKMTRRLLAGDVGKIRIFSRDEAKQHQMRVDFADPRLEFHIGDARSKESLSHAMPGVDMVFHAAALKQVPSCEFFPLQAVLTNGLGSANVIESAQENDVRSVVCLSTDKAVLPVNAMGMTKALMEKVAQAAARSEAGPNTTVSSVRYGNVMYSRGSVIPLFVQQIFDGKPLTVTNPEMTRFLLPLEVAVDLVEFAFENADAGDTFIRKAAAAPMGVLADAMLEVFEADNPIEIIGVRHGEKLYETLATEEELLKSTDEGDYWRIRMDDRGLDYAQYYTKGKAAHLHSSEDYHSHNTEQLDVSATAELLLELPEIQADLLRWRNRNSR